MSSVSLLTNILISLLCIVSAVSFGVIYKITHARGLGWIMTGFIYSVFLRISIVIDFDPVHDWSREFILPAFIMYAIGSVTLALYLRRIYQGNPPMEEYHWFHWFYHKKKDINA